jgi:hypothetical protein
MNTTQKQFSEHFHNRALLINILILFLFTYPHYPCFAQLHQPVFPALQGNELIAKVIETFKPQILLPQAMGRDTLFGKIDNQNDSLTCIYTGFTIWLDPKQDPTQAAFQNNGPDAMNTEHTYPQSLGATGVAEGDLHHLYPSRADVNAARANSPFTEIPDKETETWYYLNKKSTSVPTMNIELYSERKGDFFEPREDAKGNIARSMMYFYTMYKAQADLENPTFFESQRLTLCEWHYQDPVDEKEWQRTWKIARYQDAKPNPFVLDCSLASRTFCAELKKTCLTTAEAVSLESDDFEINVFPNPGSSLITFLWNSVKSGFIQIEVFDVLGRRLTSHNGWYSEGRNEWLWNLQDMEKVVSPLISYLFSHYNEGAKSVRRGKLFLMR